MKKILILIMFIGVICSGCSSLKVAGRAIDNPIERLKYDMTKGSTISQVDKWQDNVALPSIKIYDEIIKEYRAIQKSGEKDPIKIAQKIQKKSKISAVQIRACKEKLDNIEAIKLTDKYLYYTRLMLDRMAERLESIDKLANLKDTKEIKNVINKGRLLEDRLIWEARYGSDNASSVLIYGKSKYNFERAVSIKRGQSYETIMHTLKMPGEWLPEIRVQQNNRIIVHNQAVWVDGDQIVYVDFIDGKATSWKLVGIHNGFFNRK